MPGQIDDRPLVSRLIELAFGQDGNTGARNIVVHLDGAIDLVHRRDQFLVEIQQLEQAGGPPRKVLGRNRAVVPPDKVLDQGEGARLPSVDFAVHGDQGIAEAFFGGAVDWLLLVGRRRADPGPYVAAISLGELGIEKAETQGLRYVAERL